MFLFSGQAKTLNHLFLVSFPLHTLLVALKTFISNFQFHKHKHIQSAIREWLILWCSAAKDPTCVQQFILTGEATPSLPAPA